MAAVADELHFVGMGGEEPESKLNYFCHVFLGALNVTLYGVKPPSRNSYPILWKDYGGLHPVKGKPNCMGYVGEVESVR